MLDAAAIRNRRSHLHLSPEAAAAITRYTWPGNVRELRNAMEAAAVLCEGETIHSANLPEAISKHASRTIMPTSPKASLDEIERQHILQRAVREPTLGKAAAILGINVTTLYRKRKRYNLDVSRWFEVQVNHACVCASGRIIAAPDDFDMELTGWESTDGKVDYTASVACPRPQRHPVDARPNADDRRRLRSQQYIGWAAQFAKLSIAITSASRPLTTCMPRCMRSNLPSCRAGCRLCYRRAAMRLRIG